MFSGWWKLLIVNACVSNLFFNIIIKFQLFVDKCAGTKLLCQRNGYINPKKCDSCICPDGFTGQLCDKLDNRKYMGFFFFFEAIILFMLIFS